MVSLAYLLGLATISLATLVWTILRSRVARDLRSNIGYLVLAGTALLTLAATGAIFYGVVTFRITMTTSYFHSLMFGGCGLAITLGGISVLLLSLLFAWFGFQRGRRHLKEHSELVHFGGFNIRMVRQVTTISLVGAVKPEVWVNPEFWDRLSDDEKCLALDHERMHLLQQDNLRKLVVGFITNLYAIFPWIKRWGAIYELDSELAADDACRTRFNEGRYRSLIAKTTKFAIHNSSQMIASSLSQNDLMARLKQLALPRKESSKLAGLAVGMLGCVLSMAPIYVMLSFEVPRCLLACYLGY